MVGEKWLHCTKMLDSPRGDRSCAQPGNMCFPKERQTWVSSSGLSLTSPAYSLINSNTTFEYKQLGCKLTTKVNRINTGLEERAGELGLVKEPMRDLGPAGWQCLEVTCFWLCWGWGPAPLKQPWFPGPGGEILWASEAVLLSALSFKQHRSVWLLLGAGTSLCDCGWGLGFLRSMLAGHNKHLPQDSKRRLTV